jgi:Holliday junction resolvasome RuvABC endonuclease subunit
MRIGGVDCGGSKIAIATLQQGQLSTHVLVSKEKDRHGALRDVGAFAALYLNYCDVVYVEKPLVGRGVAASLQIAQIAGAVLSHLSVPTYFVPVGTWKKAVTGNGNAPKGLVGNTLRELHPGYSQLCGGDQDLVDATCIALYGEQQQRVVERLTAHH